MITRVRMHVARTRMPRRAGADRDEYTYVYYSTIVYLGLYNLRASLPWLYARGRCAPTRCAHATPSFRTVTRRRATRGASAAGRG